MIFGPTVTSPHFAVSEIEKRIPLIPASFEPEHVAKHGAAAPMGRSGQPNEVAPCYVFLASEEASYISGQVLHPNGGTVVGS